MRPAAIQPARLAFDHRGTPVSADYGDVYHAADGGPGQARHVFLAGNRLPARWAGRERFVILETGFGTGLNFLATCAAWRADPARPATLHYLAVERHPLTLPDLMRVHAAWPQFADLAAALRACWPIPVAGFHRLRFESGGVVLTLMLGEVQTCLKRLHAQVDAFYLDGFDPETNPAMWAMPVLQRLARLAAADATLATWCVARTVRDGLAQAGFSTQKQPGFGRKREMLVGQRMQPVAAPTPRGLAEDARQALILGAGLAGCALAQALTARGWQVHLLERHDHLAGAASGNLAGIVRPLLSRDDNLASRLNRACFLHAQRAWSELDAAGFPVRRDLSGALQIARDAAHEARQQALVETGDYPRAYVDYFTQAQASAHLGVSTARGGWWFAQGGWASPPSLCRALAQAAGTRLTLHLGREVAALTRHGTVWQALDREGRVLAQAPCVILASGAQARQLAAAAHLRLYPVRGQVTHLPQGRLPAFRHALCCEGYLTPALDGLHCLGASYLPDNDTHLRAEEHADNLHRLARILPGAQHGFNLAELGGRVGFRAATPDRLPLVGALPEPDAALTQGMRLQDMPRQPDLYGLLGLGSRGLVWATLAAELLASQLHGDPLPLEGELVDAIDPARFDLRAHRRHG